MAIRCSRCFLYQKRLLGGDNSQKEKEGTDENKVDGHVLAKRFETPILNEDIDILMAGNTVISRRYLHLIYHLLKVLYCVNTKYCGLYGLITEYR